MWVVCLVLILLREAALTRCSHCFCSMETRRDFHFLTAPPSADGLPDLFTQQGQLIRSLRARSMNNPILFSFTTRWCVADRREGTGGGMEPSRYKDTRFWSWKCSGGTQSTPSLSCSLRSFIPSHISQISNPKRWLSGGKYALMEILCSNEFEGNWVRCSFSTRTTIASIWMPERSCRIASFLLSHISFSLILPSICQNRRFVMLMEIWVVFSNCKWSFAIQMAPRAWCPWQRM